MTIVGTRPEVIKMSRVFAELDRHTRHVLVHTGQNSDYELNRLFFEDLEIRAPDYALDVGAPNAAGTIARVIAASDEVMEKECPDALLLYGDTNSGLAIIPAKRRRIPVFHMEAGNRAFDQRVPEELNRKVMDHLSDINLVLGEHARRYLLAEGIRPETIIKTGSHMPEVLGHYMPRIERSDVLERLGLSEGRYFVVSAHREENVDCRDNLRDLLDSLNALAASYDCPVIVSTHPRTRRRIDDNGFAEPDHRVRLIKPLGFSDYIKLQMNALCVLSDSGTLTEEATLLDLPAVALRQVHERPEGMDAGALVMSGLRKERVLDAVRMVTGQRREHGRMPPRVPDYEVSAVSQQVVRVVLSYVDYVNRTVWSNTD
jgi:UDP-N-acetylglucosamine 2-epimerase